MVLTLVTIKWTILNLKREILMSRKLIIGSILLMSTQAFAQTTNNPVDESLEDLVRRTHWFDQAGNPATDSSGKCIHNASAAIENHPLCLESVVEVDIKVVEPEVVPKPVVKKLAVKKTVRNIEVIDLDVLFDFDRNVLRIDQQLKLEDAVSKARKANKIIKVSVDGHADSRGTDEYNLALSQRRINTVVNYLELRGIKIDTTMAWGESKLIYNADGTENYEESRRSDVYIKVY